MTHGTLTESSVSYHPVTPDRKGREGNRKGTRGAHPSSDLTSSRSRPVDNAAAAATHDRDAWMGLRPIGGGR